MTDIRRVLVADDDEAIRRLIEYTLQQRGFEPVLVADGSQAIARASDDFLCAVIDLKMPEADGMAVLEHFRTHHPDVPVLIVSAVGQTRDAVAAVKGGAFDYVSKPFEVEELGALVESAARMGRALQQHRALREAVGRSGPPTGLVAAAAVTRDLLAAARRVAPLDLTVLVTGESGVGKGVLARLIHQASRRAAGPFITVSCPALPRDLIESELFGSEKGAFTGAECRMGRFEMAAGGHAVSRRDRGTAAHASAEAPECPAGQNLPSPGRVEGARRRFPADRGDQCIPGRTGGAQGVPGGPVSPPQCRTADRSAAA